MSLNRPLGQCFRSTRHDRILHLPYRTLATTTESPSTPEATPPPPPDATSAEKAHRYNPNLVHTSRTEKKLIATQNQYPIGSRRRRAALATSTNIPFSQLPYQCFQEARKVLLEDRAEKVREVEMMRERIAKLEAKGSRLGEGEGEVERRKREHQIRSMRKRLEDWKILADINDPLVKKRFEDGMGDMTKPIYRHLSDLQWRTYKRLVLMQRITQMNVVPDVLQSIDPTYSTSIRFADSHKVPHGEFVHSLLSEKPPVLTIQPYNAGDRLVTIAIVNPDVPNVERDAFDYRCHFLACNVKISPTDTTVDLSALDPETQVLQSWLPPHVQKGLPYQRHALFVLEQNPETLNKTYSSPSSPGTLNLTDMKSRKPEVTQREKFVLRSFMDKFSLQPRGVDLFRAKWDDGTAEVMERAGLAGGDVEFRRKRVEPLPYQRLKGERFR
ncbi:mitochondrial 54S ribosomal protein YmL35 [Saxophila tyrrhenica]|uniref:Large ribosomal subunit protein mL38 n=1 Tax=Saxophila tyrrhenica TaxID=1690608 RepID=A0AAV9P417_9PEZI|nr:mitochondrial 54S ribosomal protein YmL35 [Saxophila tyrrhenica]